MLICNNFFLFLVHLLFILEQLFLIYKTKVLQFQHTYTFSILYLYNIKRFGAFRV